MRELKFGARLGEIMQVAYVVDDLEAAAARWASFLNIGPWVLMEHFPAEEKKYYGAPTDIDLSIALAYGGGMCFELIYQHNKTPSVYSDLVDRDGFGAFHHWAIGTETFDEDVARYQSEDCEVAFSGKVVPVGGLRFAYIDTMKELRGMIELIEMGPLVEDLFAGIREQANTWNRKTVLVRPE